MSNNKKNNSKNENMVNENDFIELKNQVMDLKEQFEQFTTEYEAPITKEVYELQEQCIQISSELWFEILVFYATNSVNQYKATFILEMIKSYNNLWKTRPSERQATYALRLLAEYEEEKPKVENK